jgi:hypothetical protein
MTRLWERHIRLEFGNEMNPESITFSVSGIGALALSNRPPVDTPLSLSVGRLMPRSIESLPLSTPRVGELATPMGQANGKTTFGLVDFIELYWPAGKRWYIEFELEENFDSKVTNTGVVTVYNMSDARLNMIKERAEYLKVYAGHGPRMPGLLFYGYIEDIWSEWQGADRVTHFQIVEVSNHANTAQAYGSWPPPAPASVIVNDLVNQIAIPKGKVKIGQEFYYRQGKTFEPNVPVMRALEQIAKQTQSHAFIARGVLYVTPIDEPIGIVPWTLTPENGLIGEPEPARKARTTEQTKAAQTALEKPWQHYDKWTFTAILNPAYMPQKDLMISSQVVSGRFRITSVKHIARRKEYYSILSATKTEAKGELPFTGLSVQKLSQGRLTDLPLSFTLGELFNRKKLEDLPLSLKVSQEQ